MPLMLSRNDVMKVLDMKDCIDVTEKAFAEMANGTAVLPLRINITPPDGLSLYRAVVHPRGPAPPGDGQEPAGHGPGSGCRGQVGSRVGPGPHRRHARLAAGLVHQPTALLGAADPGLL